MNVWMVWLIAFIHIALVIEATYWWTQTRKWKHHAQQWKAAAEYLGKVVDAKVTVVDGTVWHGRVELPH